MQDELTAIVQRMIDAGESEENIALVIKEYKPQPTATPATATPAEPSFVESLLADNPALPGIHRAGQFLGRLIKNNPVESAATAGAIAAVPLTGGASIPATIAAAGLGGAGGAGLGIIGRQLATGRPESASDTAQTMVTQGALQAGGEALGPVVGGAGKLIGRGLYRAAALPINQLAKYGDLVSEGIAKRVPVSKSGLAKAGALADDAKVAKRAALEAADTRVSQRAAPIAEQVRHNLRPEAALQRKAGMGDPMPDFEAQLEQFVAENPNGTLTPSVLDAIKGKWDDSSGLAYRKIRTKEPLTPQERFTVEMGQQASRAQEAAVPGYKTLNRDVMNAQGLKRMIGRRVNPGSGGNQGLENAVTMLGGLGALPARVLMLPPVLSRLGIGAHIGGEVAEASLPSLYRTALLALLGGSEDQPQPE